MTFFLKVIMALIGKIYWSIMVHFDTRIKNTALILIPFNAKEDGKIAMQLVDRLIESKRYDNALIIYSRYVFGSLSVKNDNEKIFLKRIPYFLERAIVDFYLLSDFDSRFYYANINEPFRRKGRILIGTNGLERRDIFARGIYKITK